MPARNGVITEAVIAARMRIFRKVQLQGKSGKKRDN